MKRLIIIIKVIVLIGLICVIAMLSGCGSSCRKGDKWRKKRYVHTETVSTDSLPQFCFVKNQILIFK